MILDHFKEFQNNPVFYSNQSDLLNFDDFYENLLETKDLNLSNLISVQQIMSKAKINQKLLVLLVKNKLYQLLEGFDNCEQFPTDLILELIKQSKTDKEANILINLLTDENERSFSLSFKYVVPLMKISILSASRLIDRIACIAKNNEIITDFVSNLLIELRGEKEIPELLKNIQNPIIKCLLCNYLINSSFKTNSAKLNVVNWTSVNNLINKDVNNLSCLTALECLISGYLDICMFENDPFTKDTQKNLIASLNLINSVKFNDLSKLKDFLRFIYIK